jgi:polysaccharide export outer membrane protein
MRALRPARSRWPVPAALVLITSSLACGSVGPYTWVRDYHDPRPEPQPNAYTLGPGDVIFVRVFNQEAVSGRSRIRSDGRISLMFLNDVQAAGYTPNVLAQQLEARLKDYVNKPVVTVAVEEPRQLQIAVVGEVTRQGVVAVPPDAGVLQAIAAAGGVTELAHSDRVFVIRNEQPPTRIRFNYKSLLHAEPPESTFRLRDGDQVVVE